MSSSASAMKTTESSNTIGLPAANSDAAIAYGILRFSFGINIMIHGVSRLMGPPGGFLAYLTHYFEKAPLIPQSSLPAFAAVLPPVETALGALLLLGLFTRFSLIAGSLVMAGLVFGTNLAQDWNVAGLQLIYCFIYYFLLARRAELNKFSIDATMRKGAAN
jgi:thiosulfate dehydrogenase (quinone) large subunit